MVRLLIEHSDSKSNVKLGGFRSQLQASYVSNHTEELWYNETVCLIYIYLLLYNSFILDIEHFLYYIALGLTQTHEVI